MDQMQGTGIEKVGLGFHAMARDYALKAEAMAADPQFRQAVMKVSVSSFVWALYHAFDDDAAREALRQELKEQSAAIDRVFVPSRKTMT